MTIKFTQDENILRKEISDVWGNADFGNMTKTEVVRSGLLKCASGYAQGHTSEMILKELGMALSWNNGVNCPVSRLWGDLHVPSSGVQNGVDQDYEA